LLGFSVRVTRAYWELIAAVKRPVMRGREVAMQGVSQTPEEVRRSRGDPSALIFYRVEEPGRWPCATAKRPDDEGFLCRATELGSLGFI
jgi:hypothetical protein